MQEHSTRDNDRPAVLKVEDVARYLDIGMTKAYELVHSGQIRSVKVGRVYRIHITAIEEYVNLNRKN